MKIRKLKLDECTVHFSVSPEDLPLKGNVQASGDLEADAQAEQEIQRQLEAGHLEAWCVVECQVQWRQFTGLATLGGVSLDPDQLPDVREAIAQIGQYHDLPTLALDDLQTQLEGIADQIGGLDE